MTQEQTEGSGVNAGEAARSEARKARKATRAARRGRERAAAGSGAGVVGGAVVAPLPGRARLAPAPKYYRKERAVYASHATPTRNSGKAATARPPTPPSISTPYPTLFTTTTAQATLPARRGDDS